MRWRHLWKIAAAIVMVVVVMMPVSGCSGLRFVVDVTSADDALKESAVLEDEAAGWSAPKIALIDVTGLLVDARKPQLFAAGENPVADLAEALQKAAEDRRVRAVVLRINSPGGTVTASDVMYREVVRFRQRTGKPVVVLMADLAASGGYYLACAGDHIVAHPTTITGSIGVIIQTFNFSEGMRRVGIRAESITSGKNKAMGSPFEPAHPDHRIILQGLVNDFYQGFVEVVTAHRVGIEAENLPEITDGRVVTGRRALELGLVDQLGDVHDAFSQAKRLANVPAARLVKYHRPLRHVGSAYATSPMDGMQINLLQLNWDTSALLHTPGAYYVWDPAVFSSGE